MDNIIALLTSAIAFGTIIMYGSLGEILTEKSGNLNLGVPGIMYIGGFSGFASAYYYEKLSQSPNAILCFLIPIVCALLASMLAGGIFGFLTITLRANQNVTGLALTTFGTGIANFFGLFILNGASYTAAPLSNAAVSTQPFAFLNKGIFGRIFFSHGILVYAVAVIAVVMHFFLYKSRQGLNLRAVGENPATADAAGINVTKYKYFATCMGAGISGLGGLFYVLDYNKGIWATTDNIQNLGWLAVALVIFTTWKPLNSIWGAFVFGLLYWMYRFLPNIMNIIIPNYVMDLLQMLPYVVTIIVLIAVSMRNKKEDRPPAALGLSYFREER